MTVRLLRSAYIDLVDGRKFYERQAAHLGDYFLTCIFSDIDGLEIYACIHRQISSFHRSLSKRFPYAIYYRIIDGEAVVFRVLDCRQDPHRVRSILEQT